MARIQEELYKKDLHDPDNHNGVITHLEPGILECEVKWALPIISWQIDGETMETVTDFILGGKGPPKSLQMVTAAMKLKDACSLEEKL